MKLDGFVGPSYALPQPSANAQRLVNLYLETQEAGPRKGNPARLVGTPGLRKRATLGAGPIRGIHRATTGQLFVVSGAYLYEVTADWVGLLRPPVGLGPPGPPSGALNSSSGLVTMEDDGTRILIADGTSTAFQSDLVSGSPLIPVADADCPGGYVTWQDGYFIHSVPNSGEFQISGLNAVTYDPTDVATAEGRPDQLVIPISVNQNLWLFGEQTTEVWWNSGAADFPFERNSSAFLETGTLSAGSCVRVANSVAWLGNDARGRGTVWYAQGFQPQRISTHAIEYALASYSRLEEATAFAYQQSGHEFYVLNVPGSSGADKGGTWVYDFATGQWHERSYLNPSSGSESHRAGCAAVAFGEVVVGDRADGRVYTYDLDFHFDDADPIRRLRQAKHVSQGEKRIRFNSFELQAEAGVGLVTGQGQEPVVLLSWSDDGGHTWSNEHPASMGELGKFFTRIKWRRLGVGRDRVFRVATSEPVAISWLGAEIDAVQLSA